MASWWRRKVDTYHHYMEPQTVRMLKVLDQKLDLALAALKDLHPNTGQLSPENQAKVDEIFAIEARDKQKIDDELGK